MMVKIIALLSAVILVFLIGCDRGSSTDRSKDSPSSDFGIAAKGNVSVVNAVERSAPAVPAAAPGPPTEEMGGKGASVVPNLDFAQRKVISVASVSIEVDVVEAVVTEIRVIAEGFRGFVEQLSSSGEAESQQANITIRVPQTQFFPALERIEALGTVQNRNVGSEDVSEQFIDLEARLKSSLREEQSLLSLLEKAATVSEVLAIERELSRVRSDIERFQGQLNFLDRRVELATISIHLYPPKEQIAEPPSALLTIQVPNVSGSVSEVKALVSSLDGVLVRVFLSLHDEEERADISILVFTSDFKQALASIERQGDVQTKELREATNQMGGESTSTGDPNAQINVALIEKPGSRLILSIIASIGAVGIITIVSFLFHLTYRAGRRQARQL